jgi:4-amino-4-deoxy-L-arabinose transferase-like glycosyltransferase
VRKDTPLWILLLIALLIRLGWALSRPVDAAAVDALPDQREYLSLGQNLLAGRGLQFFDRRFGQSVYAYRMPGYPLFVAACGADLRMIRAVQAVLDVATILAVYLLASQLKCDGWVAFIAALLVAFNPFLIYFTGLILSETLFTALLVWGMWLLLRSRWAGLLLLVASVYVRPEALPLPVFIVVTAGVMEGEAARSLAFRAAAAVALTAVALIPWACRNSRADVLGKMVWTTTNDGITSYDGWNSAANGASNQAFLSQMPQLRQMNEIERSHYLGSLAGQFICAHPGRAVELAVVKIARTWSPAPLSEQFGSPVYRTVALLYFVPFDLLLLAGLIKGSLPRAAKVFLLIPAIYLTAAHAASVGSLRYLVPAFAPMAILAAVSYPACFLRRPGRVG